jgi:8-oxo-dGTP pyrophosphatase MutT (NUDIX family)
MNEPSRPIIDAAALVPVYRAGDGGLRMILIRRSEGGVYGGQVSFPGGKREPQDRFMSDTALRERDGHLISLWRAAGCGV